MALFYGAFVSKPRVYLAGPIFGMNAAEANNWREEFRTRLGDIGIIGVSPLRCEPLRGDRYGLGDLTDPRFGTPEAIAAKNFLDVQMCDLTLGYQPRAADLTFGQGSVGTTIELAWAFALRKPTILVTESAYLRGHGPSKACANWIVPTLDDAYDVISGVLQVYGG